MRSITLHLDPRDVVRAAVEASRSILTADRTFAAVPDGDALPVSITSGVQDPRFERMRVREGRGLGGQVLADRTPMRVDDYVADPRITRDFVDIVVHGEGLRSVACVPVEDSRGDVVCLLYCARVGVGGIGDRELDALGQIAGLAGVGVELANERRREIELARRQERHRLAVRLHDTVAQSLFAIGVSARSGRTDETATLEEIARIADGARGELRDAIERLELEPAFAGCGARLESELDLFRRRNPRCEVRMVQRGQALELPPDVEDLVVDTVVEGLRNAVKHCAARRAVVHVAARPGGVEVAVQTEIPARPVAGAAPAGAGAGTRLGLAMLRHHARRVGGRLELELDGDLATLRLQVPVPSAPAERAAE